jgi:hypothetical protein
MRVFTLLVGALAAGLSAVQTADLPSAWEHDAGRPGNASSRWWFGTISRASSHTLLDPPLGQSALFPRDRTPAAFRPAGKRACAPRRKQSLSIAAELMRHRTRTRRAADMKATFAAIATAATLLFAAPASAQGAAAKSNESLTQRFIETAGANGQLGDLPFCFCN